MLDGMRGRHLFQAPEQVGEELFLARDDPGELPDVGLLLRVIDGGEECGRAVQEEERGLVVDVGDEQGGEEEAVASTGEIERGEEGVLFFGEMREGQLLDLRDGEAMARLVVRFAVGVDRLLGRVIVSSGEPTLKICSASSSGIGLRRSSPAG